MTDPQARIALIHAVQLAVAPVERAFAELWPKARCTNLLDDALGPDLERAGALTPAITARIRNLAAYAVSSGADAVLFTCSAFGEAISAAAHACTVPVLKPNEAMFDAAMSAGRRIGMLATFAPAVAPMEQEFRSLAVDKGADVTLDTVCIPEARAAAAAGDTVRHNALIADGASRLAHCDAIMLAHFSTSTALAATRSRVSCPVFGAPEAAVAHLKTLLTRR